MNYMFFALDYRRIYSLLSIIEEKKDKETVVIATPSKEIEAFLKRCCRNEINILYMDTYHNIFSKKGIHGLFRKLLYNKKRFKELFHNVEGWEIYFFTTGSDVVTYSFIKKLSKKNKVFFYSKIHKTQFKFEYPVEHSFRAWILRLGARILCDVETIVTNIGYCSMFQLHPKFFESNNIQIIPYTVENPDVLKKYAAKLDILKGKKILIAISDLVTTNNFIEESEFTNKIDDVMDILDKIFPNSYVIKPHPRENRLYGKMSNCKEIIPSYIPFEFLLTHPWKIVISIISTSLTSAVKETDATVISLIDLIEFKNKDRKEKIRNWLEKETKKKIKFPSNMMEFERLLKEVKNISG